MISACLPSISHLLSTITIPYGLPCSIAADLGTIQADQVSCSSPWTVIIWSFYCLQICSDGTGLGQGLYIVMRCSSIWLEFPKEIEISREVKGYKLLPKRENYPFGGCVPLGFLEHKLFFLNAIQTCKLDNFWKGPIWIGFDWIFQIYIRFGFGLGTSKFDCIRIWKSPDLFTMVKMCHQSKKLASEGFEKFLKLNLWNPLRFFLLEMHLNIYHNPLQHNEKHLRNRQQNLKTGKLSSTMQDL